MTPPKPKDELYVLEKWKLWLTGLLLLFTLASTIGSYQVMQYRMNELESYIAYIDDDYVSKETLTLKLDNMIIKLDNLDKKLDEHNRQEMRGK